MRAVADHRIVADKIASLQHDVRADANAFADGAMRSNVRRGINIRGRRDDGGRMNAGGKRRFRKKNRQRFGEGDARVGDADENFFVRDNRLAANDGGGGAVFGGG